MKGTIRFVTGVVMVYFGGGYMRVEDTLTPMQMWVTLSMITVGVFLMMWGTLAVEEKG